MQLVKQGELVAGRRTVYFVATISSSGNPYTTNLLNSEIKLSKAGGAEANATNGSTHIANGLHSLVLTTAECDTFGVISIRNAQSTCYGDVKEVLVVGFDPFDATSMGLGYLANPVLSANSQADAILDRANGIETGMTLRQALRLTAAVLGGRLSGSRTGVEVFRNAVADSKNRVTATIDSSGNRTVITTDLT